MGFAPRDHFRSPPRGRRFPWFSHPRGPATLARSGCLFLLAAECHFLHIHQAAQPFRRDALIHHPLRRPGKIAESPHPARIRLPRFQRQSTSCARMMHRIVQSLTEPPRISSGLFTNLKPAEEPADRFLPLAQLPFRAILRLGYFAPPAVGCVSSRWQTSLLPPVLEPAEHIAICFLLPMCHVPGSRQIIAPIIPPGPPARNFKLSTHLNTVRQNAVYIKKIVIISLPLKSICSKKSGFPKLDIC